MPVLGSRIEPDTDPEWERELQWRAQNRRRGCFKIAMIVALYSVSVGSACWLFSTSGLFVAMVSWAVALLVVNRIRGRGNC